MTIPENLKYTKSHEWVEFINETTARIGITDFAQSQMGDIVFINLPEEGDDAVASEPLTDIESVKAVADVLAPVTGTVKAVNTELDDQPELLNTNPYESWICEVTGITATEELMDAAAYKALLGSEGA